MPFFKDKCLSKNSIASNSLSDYSDNSLNEHNFDISSPNSAFHKPCENSSSLLSKDFQFVPYKKRKFNLHDEQSSSSFSSTHSDHHTSCLNSIDEQTFKTKGGNREKLEFPELARSIERPKKSNNYFVW